jgi:ribosomal protein S8
LRERVGAIVLNGEGRDEAGVLHPCTPISSPGERVWMREPRHQHRRAADF